MELRRIFIAITASIIIIAVIGFGVVQLQQYGNKNISTDEHTKMESPEFFLEQSLSTFYRDDGNIDYQFNGEYLEHFKAPDVVRAKLVYFIFYGKDGTTWHARADNATFTNANKNITLSNNVRIWRPTRNVELTTEKIMFDETRQYAETDKPVTIKSPVGITRGIGLKADLRQENLQLLSTVTGLYHAKK